MSKPLEKEFKYYLDNQDKLVEKYNGKFIVIKVAAGIGKNPISLSPILSEISSDSSSDLTDYGSSPGVIRRR